MIGCPMFNEFDYAVIWGAYLASVFVLLYAWWRLSRRFPTWLRDPLRAVAFVLLLMPELVDPASGLHAPALFVAGFELATTRDGGAGTILGVRLLLASSFAVLLAWSLRLAWNWLFARQFRVRRRVS